MSFKGRTVALLVGAAMLASSVVTLAAVDLPSLAGGGQAAATGKGLSPQEMQKINSVLGIIENKYVTPVEREKIVNGAVHGMISALQDPYSSYMEAEEAQQFNNSVEGAFTGIGAVLAMKNGEITVIFPIKGSPAEKAGVKSKDVFLSINGESLSGKTLNEAVEKIRGSKGTKAKIEIKRAGQSEPIELTVIRDEVDLETVYPKMLDDKIGYFEVRQFSMNTFERFKEALQNLEKQDMKGLVIDVRNNPGGVLDIVQKMMEQFVPKGKTIVQVENRNKERDKYNSQGTSTTVKPYPIAVLTNKGSASASEIMASALKESAGAKLVGEQTFGKGTVQVGYASGDGGMIKITIAKWLTPDGHWIHQKGIEPDIVVHQPEYYSVAPLPRDKTLKFAMNDADVKHMQLMLDGLGYKPGRTDGYFSKETEAALKSFQRAAGLSATGQVDAKTAEKLEADILKAMRDPKNDAQLNKAVETVKQEIR